MARGIIVLGSTGSIGQQALDVIRANPAELRVAGLAAGQNLDLLARQVQEHAPAYVSAPSLAPGSTWNGARALSLIELCQVPDAERVLVSTVGATGLLPTLAAIRAEKTVLLANKEVLVMAGELVIAEARRVGIPILPVDSEHNAVWQCFAGDCLLGAGTTDGPLRRIVLTASGGAFRDLSPDQLTRVTPTQALAHPNWVMGPKVTVDCATLMNKAFEVVEAHWLFGLRYDQIDVVLHRESVVHALVEFVDGSFKAELSLPDMRIPIQHALTYPERRPSTWPRLRIEALGQLTFAPLDHGRYPCFDLALAAASAGGTVATALSAADDVAVDRFLDGRIAFTEIPELIDRAVQAHQPIAHPTVDDVLSVDEQVRRDLERRLGQSRRRA
ncbi:MAG TPA: 1-deoxy-D-xylulose-5-phosphate reductoisomerase [Chloroflexota bacterium]|nr:1-deoxy-D-xylulose-5-phosphate reductoisomerase [Chloroflexota bacterium]